MSEGLVVADDVDGSVTEALVMAKVVDESVTEALVVAKCHVRDRGGKGLILCFISHGLEITHRTLQEGLEPYRHESQSS